MDVGQFYQHRSDLMISIDQLLAYDLLGRPISNIGIPPDQML